jgi:branched-chain amino acid transport system substrate-binding protein
MRTSILLAIPLTIALCAAPAHAQQPGKTPSTVKIGVLSDMSGLYADIGGPGSVAAANMAVEDFNPASHGMKVEIVSGDHQNKPDIGSEIARRWFDVDHVNAIADVPNSGVALAVSNVTREKNRVFLVPGIIAE